MSYDSIDLEDALDGLVDQFADPLSFLRELVQNAIDAGSPEIDVRFEYEKPEPGDEGLMKIHVDDFGEGMNREIIDTRLTRLFSSGKDGDFTKIGRFGIGFVSVFALKPDLVILDTSRGGENWRVIFHGDRSFERIAMPTPVDGTKVQLVKRASHETFQATKTRAKEVLSYWCRYARAEILFEGEAIGEDFAANNELSASYEADDTRIFTQFSEKRPGAFGFYNRGLTLMEGPGTDKNRVIFEHVEFRIDSRYLEHTLSRDNVLRDENFAKAMTLVRQLVEDALPKKLFDSLESAAVAEQTPMPPYQNLLRWVRLVQGKNWPAEKGVKRFADLGIFPSLLEGAVSIAQCRKAAEENLLYVAESAPRQMVAAIQSRGGIVVRAAPGTLLTEVLTSVALAKPADLHRAWVFVCADLPEERSEQQSESEEQALNQAVAKMLALSSHKVRSVRTLNLNYPGSQVAERVGVALPDLNKPTPYDSVAEIGGGWFSKRHLVLNGEHAIVKSLTVAAPFEPELAAYLITKLLFTRSELSPELDARLLKIATEQRCQRLTNS